MRTLRTVGRTMIAAWGIYIMIVNSANQGLTFDPLGSGSTRSRPTVRQSAALDLLAGWKPSGGERRTSTKSSTLKSFFRLLTPASPLSR